MCWALESLFSQTAYTQWEAGGGGRDGTGRGEWGGDDGTGAWDKGVVMLNVFIGVLAILVSLGQEF